MKGYKGFNKNMTCRDFQYEEGKEYKHEGEVKACNAGFHACEDPIDCFGYYPPATSVYHEVEQDGDISKDGEDSKVASSVIKIGARLNVAGIARAHFEYVKARTTFEHTDPKQATAGDSGAATAGNYGAATAGYSGAATAGDSGAATSRGSSIVGKEGIACARGNGCKVKGGLGAVLVLVEENDGNYGIKAWKAEVVDGERIKKDTFYTLKDGEFIECESEDK